MKTKRTLFVFTTIILFSCNVFSQDSYIKNRWNIKVSHARYQQTHFSSSKKTSNFRIEGNYGINNYFEAGIYLGVSNYDLLYPFDEQQNDNVISGFIENCISPSYGVNVNFHILPLFIKKPDFRFDLYVSGKYGGIIVPAKKENPYDGYHHECGIGLGLGFYPWKHLGFFAEYSYGKYHIKAVKSQNLSPYDTRYRQDNTKLRYGITIKF